MLDSRKKRGLALMVGGILGVVVGVVLFTTGVTPDWVSIVVTVVSAVAEAFGINITRPEE